LVFFFLLYCLPTFSLKEKKREVDSFMLARLWDLCPGVWNDCIYVFLLRPFNKFPNLYPSPNIIRVIKRRRKTLVGHRDSMVKKYCVNRFRREISKHVLNKQIVGLRRTY
jgi:hypothetical protein